MKKFMGLIYSVGLVTSFLFFSGCDMGSSSGKVSNSEAQGSSSGVYVDGPVKGVEYKCGSQSGYTDEDGVFYYDIGKSCTFKIGSLVIRTVSASKLSRANVTIQETNTKVAQLLLSLDSDGDYEYIHIDNTIARELEDSYYNKNINNIDLYELIKHINDSFKNRGIVVDDIKVISSDAAKQHLEHSYKHYCKDRGFVLADNSNSFGQCSETVSGGSSTGGGSSSGGGTSTGGGSISGGGTSAGGGSSSGGGTSTGGSSSTGGGTSTGGSSSTQTYDYIPKGSSLTDAMAVKFLNMATFGSTPELVKELRSKGVVKWVDEQLAMKYDAKKESVLRRLISHLTTAEKDTKYYSSKCLTLDSWFNDTKCKFNKSKRNGPDELSENYAAIFNANLAYKNQLRQRAAYALSQIVVASQSNDEFFRDRGESLSYYYDVLQKNAFNHYGDLLYDITMSSTMATFLTYANSRKEYVDKKTGATILPDENYGREIMQLFTIGLYELNMDGTEERGSGGNRVSTYVQEDVNNMSRVFTGLGYGNVSFDSSILHSDTTRPLKCEMKYHDTELKKILGQILPAGQTCEQDVRSAIGLLMSHQNVAPFITKKLIRRFTKSNPEDDYVRRVAQVFADTKGNLGLTIKALLLDEEIWGDIKAGTGTKIKEPYFALTNTIRALDGKPLPYVQIRNTDRNYIKINNYGFYTRSLYHLLGQWVTNSPTVFNFYSDEFVPDDGEFKVRGFVAPELEIITTQYNVAFVNALDGILRACSVSYQADAKRDINNNPGNFQSSSVNLYFDYKDEIEICKNNGFGANLNESYNDAAVREKIVTKLIDDLSIKLLGKVLPDAQRNLLIDKYSKNDFSRRDKTARVRIEKIIVENWVAKMVLDITHTDNFMVQ